MENTAFRAPLNISILDERLAVCRRPPGTGIPAWATAGSFFCITRAVDELSVICAEEHAPADARCEPGWRALWLEGPFDFGEVGVLVSLAQLLAEVGVSIFAISTYDTDYVLIKEEQLEHTISALRERGHNVD